MKPFDTEIQAYMWADENSPSRPCTMLVRTSPWEEEMLEYGWNLFD